MKPIGTSAALDPEANVPVVTSSVTTPVLLIVARASAVACLSTSLPSCWRMTLDVGAPLLTSGGGAATSPHAFRKATINGTANREGACPRGEVIVEYSRMNRGRHPPMLAGSGCRKKAAFAGDCKTKKLAASV